MTIKGDARHLARLNRIKGRAIVEEVGKRTFVAADRVRAEAQFLIAQGSIQGAGHKPSVAPAAPNLQSGVLTAGITAHRVGPLKSVAESAAPYALAQEYGATIKNAFGRGITVVLPERPYMRPAAKLVKGDYAISIRAGVNEVLRKA